MKIVKYKNHPLVLSDMDCERIQAMLDGKLDKEYVSMEELEAFQDMLYDYIAAESQTHYGSLVLH